MSVDPVSSAWLPESAGPWHAVALGLGSNIGAREQHLQAAVAALGDMDGFVIEQVSDWIETAPEGGPKGQGPYLNGALCGRTRLAPRTLLKGMHRIEAERGRIREPGLRNEPRTLDLDLLLFGTEEIHEPDLVVPHPRLIQRTFVLLPLAQIAADWLIPPGDSTVQDQLAFLQQSAAVAGTDLP